MCASVCGYMCVTAWSEDNSVELVFSFHFYVGSGESVSGCQAYIASALPNEPWDTLNLQAEKLRLREERGLP